MLSSVLFSESYEKLDFSTYTLNHWDIYSGLNSDSITSIYEDSKGYIWIGSYDGIIRFNGREFISFDESNTKGIIGHSGNIFFENGTDLWIGTGQGLLLYSEGVFKTFTKESGLLSNNIGTISRDNSGTLWVGTNQGLQIFLNGKFISPDYKTKNPFTGRAVNFIAYHKTLGLIVSCTDGGVYVNSQDNPTLINGSMAIQVSSLIVKDSPIIGTRSGKLYQITSNGLIPFIPLPVVDSSVRDMFYNDDSIWVVTTKGLYKINQNKTLYILQNDSNYGILDNVPKHILEDSRGIIWIGTRSGGLYALSPSPFITYNQHNGLTSSSVNSVAEFPENIYWFATDSGICYKDELGFGENKLTDFLQGIRIKHLNATEDKLYISTISDYGVVVWDGESIETISKDQGIPHRVVKKTIFDKKGNLWVSTSNGVVSISPDDEVKIYNKSNGFLSNEIYDIFVDTSNRVWVTTVTDGLLRIEENGSYQRFSEREGLIGEMVFSIREDIQGDFWVSTASGGFFIRADDTIFPISYKHGLPYLYIYNAQPLKENLYFTSVKGLSIASLKDVKDVAIGLKDNFDSKQLNWKNGLAGSPNALSWLYIDSHENIWIPTHKGVSSYNTGNEYNTKPRIDVKIYIEKITTENKAVQDITKKFIDKPAQYLKLNYSIPGLDYQPVYFSYFLEGYSKHWSNYSMDYQATYTNVLHGHYNFKIKAFDKFFNEIAYNEIEIVIERETLPISLIIIFILLLACTCGFFIYIKKVKSKKNSNNHLDWEQIQKEYKLSPRELEVTKLVISGKKDKEIAVEITCAVSTVSNTLTRIYSKTSTGGRYDLINVISTKIR